MSIAKQCSEPSQRLLNQLWNELDGVHGRLKGLLSLAATNEPRLLDQALLRLPRFSERCYIPLPDQAGQRRLLELGRVRLGFGTLCKTRRMG